MTTSATLIIRNETGLHARPAALFVDAARKYASAITVGCAGKSGNAKSITALMLLGAGKGAEITITADGPDEQDAVQVLTALIESWGRP